MQKGYQVGRCGDGKFRLVEGNTHFPYQGDRSIQFYLEQDAHINQRTRFNQLLEAAKYAADNLINNEVHWTFNGVPLNTDMEHSGDIWAQYTELNAQMAN